MKYREYTGFDPDGNFEDQHSYNIRRKMERGKTGRPSATEHKQLDMRTYSSALLAEILFLLNYTTENTNDPAIAARSTTCMKVLITRNATTQERIAGMRVHRKHIGSRPRTCFKITIPEGREDYVLGYKEAAGYIGVSPAYLAVQISKGAGRYCVKRGMGVLSVERVIDEDGSKTAYCKTRAKTPKTP